MFIKAGTAQARRSVEAVGLKGLLNTNYKYVEECTWMIVHRDRLYIHGCVTTVLSTSV